MERKTLLQMTKDILEMMESDLVSSINDTLESQMVHKEIRNTYMHIMARQEWAHLQKPKNLNRAVTTTTLTDDGGATSVTDLTVTTSSQQEATTDNISHAIKTWAGLKFTSVGTGLNKGAVLNIISDVTGDRLIVGVEQLTHNFFVSSIIGGVTTTTVLAAASTPSNGSEFVVAFDSSAGTYKISGYAGTFNTPYTTVPLPDFTGGFKVSGESELLTNTLVYKLLLRGGDTTSPTITGYSSFESGQNPVVVSIPVDVSEIKYLKYQTNSSTERLHLSTLEYLPPDEFLNLVQNYDTTQGNVTFSDIIYDDIDIPFICNKHPQYWTSFDNTNIVVDSYNTDDDEYGLRHEKTQVLAVVTPSWTETDSFIPDMPPQLFPMLVYEAAEACIDLHKQDEKATTSKRALLHRALQKTKEIRHNGKSKTGFGRR